MANFSRIGMHACVVVLMAGAASVASADITPEVFSLQAEVGGNTGSFVVTMDDGYFDDQGNFFWSLDGDVNIYDDNGDMLATLSNASVSIFADPVISMNFNVQATNQNTIFTVDSGLLSFATINGALGAASAGVTVTDTTGDGATLTPEGGTMYSSQYNGLFPNGTPFADLINAPLTAGAFSTSDTSDAYPGGGGFVNIGDPVDSMSAAWHFTLSPLDVASGTSTFTVVPTPASIGLLGLGGLVALRRRR